MDLVSRYAFLGGGEQEQRGKPFRERDFAALKNGLDGHRELLTAFGALVKARTVSLNAVTPDVTLSASTDRGKVGLSGRRNSNPRPRPWQGREPIGQSHG
jgi:hypothetical protein